MSELSQLLRERGFDVEPPRPGHPEGDIVARQDRGNRATVLSADASGRFRVEITWQVGEWPSRQEIAGVPVRIVDSVTRSVSITGAVADLALFAAIIDGLAALVPWADAGAAPAREDASDRV